MSETEDTYEVLGDWSGRPLDCGCTQTVFATGVYADRRGSIVPRSGCSKHDPEYVSPLLRWFRRLKAR